MAAVIGIFVVALIVVVLVIMASGKQGGFLHQTAYSNPGAPLVGFLGELVIYAALLPVITSFQRLVLQGRGARVGLIWRREEWLAVGALARQILASQITLIVVFLIAGLFILIADALKAHWLVFIVALPLFLVWLISYLCWTLMLPAAAVGDYLSPKDAIRLARGNYGRILVIMLSPAFLILVPQISVLGFVQQAHLSTFATILFCVGLLVLYYFELLIFSAVWALVYGQLSKAKADLRLEDGALPDPVI